MLANHLASSALHYWTLSYKYERYAGAMGQFTLMWIQGAVIANRVQGGCNLSQEFASGKALPYNIPCVVLSGVKQISIGIEVNLKRRRMGIFVVSKVFISNIVSIISAITSLCHRKTSINLLGLLTDLT